MKTAQTRLDHANASITLGWYAHAIPEKDHEAADLLGSLLASKPEEGKDSEASTSENAVKAPEEDVDRKKKKCLHFVSSRSNPRHKRSRPAA